MNHPTLLISDDHILVREGFSRLLEGEYDIVGVCQDGKTVIADAERLRPELILLDIAMPEMSGLEVMRRLRVVLPESRVLIVTQHEGHGYVREAFRAGAMGYVLKQCSSVELLKALKEVHAGHYYVTPLVTGGIQHPGVRPLVNPSELFGKGLTTRQSEVLKLVAQGKQVEEIAAVLNISPKTVEYHKSVLMEELGLYNTAELTRYAIENGLV